MKITDRTKRKKIEFRYVDAGTIFKYVDEYYLATKIVEDLVAYYNCVNLNSGKHYYFGDDDIVEVVEVEMIVK